ncbi:MAG: hypothetical protein K8I27_17200 [Planctomycetes bacterium]|nr:hypothetical protein [Planctomycetota bacterium]
MRTLIIVSLAALVLSACSSTPKIEDPPSPLAAVEQFYAAPVIYDFEVPEDWEIPGDEWAEKTADFTEAWVKRLEVTRRAPIERLQGDLPPGGAAIRLIVREVDLGFHAGLIRKPAICWGEVIITDAAGGILKAWDVEFRTPGDAGHQWWTYGGRLESAHDAFAVEVISWIQRERN